MIARLISIQDALRGAALTVGAGFVGLAVANKEEVVAFAAIPLILLIAVSDARNHLVFRRVSQNARLIEQLVRAYIGALKEAGPVRQRAIGRLQREVDRYRFGAEHALRDVKLRLYLRATLGRPSWYVYVFVMMVLIIGGLLVRGRSSSESVCVIMPDGARIELGEHPQVRSGSLTVVPCAAKSQPPG